MFHTIRDFEQEYGMEAAITMRALEALTDESLDQKVSDEGRTLGRIAWHLVHSLNYMANLGLSFDMPLADELMPASASGIAGEYRRMGQSMLRAVKSQWTDETLGHTANAAGMEMKRGMMLRFILRHEIHHRGQMTVLMRQAGLRIPDVLGPTREDWLVQGMEPLA